MTRVREGKTEKTLDPNLKSEFGVLIKELLVGAGLEPRNTIKAVCQQFANKKARGKALLALADKERKEADDNYQKVLLALADKETEKTNDNYQKVIDEAQRKLKASLKEAQLKTNDGMDKIESADNFAKRFKKFYPADRKK
jgi:hypothetical protein